MYRVMHRDAVPLLGGSQGATISVDILQEVHGPERNRGRAPLGMEGCRGLIA